jgi:hypothetical protein
MSTDEEQDLGEAITEVQLRLTSAPTPSELEICHFGEREGSMGNLPAGREDMMN